MVMITLPTKVETVFHNFLTCEFTTLSKDGTPITWPVLPIYVAARGQFFVLTSIGLPQKAYNIRRNPHVSLFYSEPTGSELVGPPAVLVQGEAQVTEPIITSVDTLNADLVAAFKIQAQTLIKRQPGTAMYMHNWLTRYLMDWYFMRLLITVTPCRFLWWDRGDFTRAPYEQEVTHVDTN